jgi:hypothetical protein
MRDGDVERSDIDDCTALARDHLGQHVATAEKDALEIERPRLIFLRRLRFKRRLKVVVREFRKRYRQFESTPLRQRIRQLDEFSGGRPG